MTQYTDLPLASNLYAESERTQAAVSNIDAGGLLINFTIGSPPVVPTPPSVPGVPTPIPPASMPVIITLTAPPTAQLMGDLRAWLVQHQADLNNQLAAIEISNTPAPIPPAKV